MRLTRFRTVRGRLLAIMAAVALPIAIGAGIAAVTTYRAVIVSLETAQLRAADDLAIRARVWYRGATRTLVASASAVASTSDRTAADCAQVGRPILELLSGFLAFHVELADGSTCTATATADPALSSNALDAVLARLGELPGLQSWTGRQPLGARYDYVTVGNARYLAVYANPPAAGSGFRQAVMLIDPDLLDQVFDFGVEREGLHAALVGRGGEPVTTRGNPDTSWLPQTEVVPDTLQRWSGPSRNGVQRAYAARMVAEPDFYVIASFDGTAERAAWLQLWSSLLLPALMLMALAIFYTRAIDRHCIHWLRMIEAVARARPSQTGARVAVAPDMPTDIRSVADAFNEMVQGEERRQHKLQSALDDNRYLVRELHHRVKNSLQVVQSYLGLAKREHRGEVRAALADAECRVHVLSAAYRFTLADGEMQPVRVDLFLDDVVTVIANLLRQRDQSVEGHFETGATLAVDRIIPLGFLIVDIASRALRAMPGLALTVTVEDIDDSRIEVVVRADRQVALSDPPRMVAGLVAQVEAEAVAPEDTGVLGIWRITHAR